MAAAQKARWAKVKRKRVSLDLACYAASEVDLPSSTGEGRIGVGGPP
jgi:hypothetical protein